MALIKPTKEQRKFVKKQLVTWARSQPGPVTTTAAHRMFHMLLRDLGIGAQPISVGRAPAPSYGELGMTRKAGPPTEADREAYRLVTGGADLPEVGSFVTHALFNDTDLLTDRFMVKSTKTLFDLYDRYRGRANDFNHSFDVLEARCRVIDLGIGTDPNVVLHPDTPIAALEKLNPHGKYNGQYMALWSLLAFPPLAGDDTIDRIRLGLIKDLSIAFADSQVLCSICVADGTLQEMVHSMCFTECPEHGFPGGRTEEGTLVAGIIHGVEDALTFGLVSDGAVKRACLVLDPAINS